MKRTYLSGEQGTTAVEFVLTVVVLLMFIFGIIEFGVLLYDKHVLTNASREGARVGIVMRPTRVTNAEIQDVVEEFAQSYLVSFQPSNLALPAVTREGELLAPPRPPRFGDELKVSVTYDYDFLFLSNFGLGPITLTAETRMKME